MRASPDKKRGPLPPPEERRAADPLFLHLSLFDFKKVKCPERRYHEIGKCWKFHNDCDMIRNPRECQYKNIKCPKNNCSHTDCSLSRNYLEKMYHPETYKRKICFEYFSRGVCKYDEFCALAHSFLELKIPLLNFFVIDRDFLLFHFKTEFCPFNLFEHDKFLCVYAHNYQDYRRKWSQDLEPKMCQDWDPNTRVEIYEQACPKGFHCQFCHGWKELDYHKSMLKKVPCKKLGACERKHLCSYYHSNADRYFDIESDHFSVVPCNRVFDAPNSPCSVEITKVKKNTELDNSYETESNFPFSNPNL